MKRTLRTFVEVLPFPRKMYKSEFSIPFPSQMEAEVAYNSLRVEVEPSRSEQNKDTETNVLFSRSKVTRVLKTEGNCLKVTFTAIEMRNLGVSVGGFFEHLILVTETIRQFG